MRDLRCGCPTHRAIQQSLFSLFYLSPALFLSLLAGSIMTCFLLWRFESKGEFLKHWLTNGVVRVSRCVRNAWVYVFLCFEWMIEGALPRGHCVLRFLLFCRSSDLVSGFRLLG